MPNHSTEHLRCLFVIAVTITAMYSAARAYFVQGVAVYEAGGVRNERTFEIESTSDAFLLRVVPVKLRAKDKQIEHWLARSNELMIVRTVFSPPSIAPSNGTLYFHSAVELFNASVPEFDSSLVQPIWVVFDYWKVLFNRRGTVGSLTNFNIDVSELFKGGLQVEAIGSKRTRAAFAVTNVADSIVPKLVFFTNLNRVLFKGTNYNGFLQARLDFAEWSTAPEPFPRRAELTIYSPAGSINARFNCTVTNVLTDSRFAEQFWAKTEEPFARFLVKDHRLKGYEKPFIEYTATNSPIFSLADPRARRMQADATLIAKKVKQYERRWQPLVNFIGSALLITLLSVAIWRYRKREIKNKSISGG
jgi:hypothetical protein